VIPAARASLLVSVCLVRDRFGLRVADGPRRDLVAILFAGEDLPDELLPFGLGGLRWCEEEVKDILGALDASPLTRSSSLLAVPDGCQGSRSVLRLAGRSGQATWG
jgi:hypothetical protein